MVQSVNADVPTAPVERRVLDAPFVIGDWHADPQLNRLQSSERRHTVEPKVMEVLAVLAARPGRVFSRDELLEAVWPDADVQEHPLNRAVSTLRKLFDDDPGEPRYIETIRKRGYRVIAPVYPAGPSPTAERRRDTGASAWIGGAVTVALLAGLLTWGLILRQPITRQPTASKPLTALPGREFDPAFSPDGRQVAYAWDGGGDFDIYLTLVDGDGILQLTRGSAQDRHPAWAPDGSELAFVRHGADGGCSLRRVGALGGRSLEIASCGDIHGLDWSPDGARVASGNRPAPGVPRRIEMVAIGTGKTEIAVTPPDGILGDRDPAFSPDGRWLAFTRVIDHGVMDLYLVDPKDPETLRALTRDGRKINGFSWSRDGRFIVLNSTRSGIYGLWRLDIATGSTEPLRAAGESAHYPDVATDRRIVFEDIVHDNDLRRLSLDTLRSEPVFPSTRWDGYPALAPDGERVAFASNRAGPPEIWIGSLGSPTPERLTDLGGTLTGSPAFSPDGRRVAFDARPEGHGDIFVAAMDDGRIRQVVDHPADDLAPSWSPDGTSIYFASNRSGDWQIWRQPVAAGPPQRVTEGGGFRCQAVRDGIYFTRPGRAGIWFRPAGGASELVVARLDPSDHLNWTVSRDGLYFVDRSDGAHPRLARFRPESSASEIVGEMDGSIVNHGLAISPDGRWLYYAHRDRIESDLRLLDF